MKISCVCPTFGRAHLVVEAVESFRRQKPVDADVELLIVNDCQEQPLSCSMPGVRIVNLPEMCSDASTKFNAAVAEAKDADWIAWWEDDDISLPHRLQMSVAAIKGGAFDYWKQSRAWMCNDGRISGAEGNLFFGNAFFKKCLWDEVGGATPNDWADLTPHNKMQDAAGSRFLASDCRDPDLFFVYCWAGRGHHDSGHGGTAAQRAEAFYVNTLKDPQFQPGPQQLVARWKRDYQRLIEEFINREKQ